MTILPNAEKQGELVQLGGWQKEMARRRYQKGNLRKRSKRNPVWELQWWTDCIKSGRNARTKAGIDDSQLCVRPHSAASAQACRGTSSSLEFGQGHAAFEFTVAGIRGAAPRPQCLPPPLILSTQGRYRHVKLDFNHLQPFGSLAFPFSETRKTAVKQPIFFDELLTSSRKVSSSKLCRIGLR